MPFLTYSIGILCISWVSLRTSSARSREEGLGSHFGICRRKGMTFAMEDPGKPKCAPSTILWSAAAMHGSSMDLTSYPYIVDIGIPTDNLGQKSDDTTLKIWNCSLASCYDIQTFQGRRAGLEALRGLFEFVRDDRNPNFLVETYAGRSSYDIAMIPRNLEVQCCRSIPCCENTMSSGFKMGLMVHILLDHGYPWPVWILDGTVFK